LLFSLGAALFAPFSDLFVVFVAISNDYMALSKRVAELSCPNCRRFGIADVPQGDPASRFHRALNPVAMNPPSPIPLGGDEVSKVVKFSRREKVSRTGPLSGGEGGDVA
jgi:hypothetical protein